MKPMTNALAGTTMPADRGGDPKQTGAAKAAQRGKEHGYDQAMHSAGNGQTQRDGTPTNMGQKPTKAPLQTRGASPTIDNSSGMERSMAALADKLHPPKQGRR